MNDPKIQVLLDELYKELHYLKMKAIKEFYDEYRENMIGCLWEIPNSTKLIWLPINQKPRLPSFIGWPKAKLKDLRMTLLDKVGIRRVRVRCLNCIEHRDYDDGWGFYSLFLPNYIKPRLINEIERALGERLSEKANDFDPRYPPGNIGVVWTFKNCYYFPTQAFNSWTANEIRQCNIALTNGDLRVKLIPDSERRCRCLRSSIISKLSCTTELYKTACLSENDAEEAFRLGPNAIGWEWCLKGNPSSSTLDKFPCTLKNTETVELQDWKETELKRLEGAIEQGYLYLVPVKNTSNGGSEICDGIINQRELLQRLSSEALSSIEKLAPINIETPSDKKPRSYESTIEKLINEQEITAFPGLQDQSWLQLLEKHGVSKTDYVDWLNCKSSNFEKPPVSKSTSSLSIDLPTPSSSALTSLPLSNTKFKDSTSCYKELMTVSKTSVALTTPQIRAIFTDHQNKMFDMVYEEILNQCTVEIKKSLEEQHYVQTIAINAELLEMRQEKLTLQDQILKLQDQLAKTTSELEKSKDEFLVKNTDAQKYIDSLMNESTIAQEEKERTEIKILDLLEKEKTLEKELNEGNSKWDEMKSTNRELARQVENLGKESNEAKATEIKRKERFEALYSEMETRLHESSEEIMKINMRQLELEEEKNNLEHCISKLRATNKVELENARAEGERVGRELVLKDLEYIQERELEAMKRAHLKQIQLVRGSEYHEGMGKGEDTQTDEKALQSLAVTSITEQKTIISSDQRTDDDTHIAAGLVEQQYIAPQHLVQSPIQPAPIQSNLVQLGSIPLTPARGLTHDFPLNHNLELMPEHELELLPDSSGAETIPSKLAEFNHTFLQKIFGSDADFWNNMQLMLTVKSPNRTKSCVQWPLILKIQDNMELTPYHQQQQPSTGRHGALLLLHNLDDTVFSDSVYPTFQNTVQGHSVYIGQYQIIKQRVNDPGLSFLRDEFKDYLLEDQLKVIRGKKWFKQETGSRKINNTINKGQIKAAFENGKIKTSWTILKFIGFNLKDYEALLTQYSQIEPFRSRKKGIPTMDVEGGFEHTLLNQIMNRSLMKRVHDIEDTRESGRKRQKKSQEKGTPKPPFIQQLEDESTIVVDDSPKRRQLL